MRKAKHLRVKDSALSIGQSVMLSYRGTEARRQGLQRPPSATTLFRKHSYAIPRTPMKLILNGTLTMAVFLVLVALFIVSSEVPIPSSMLPAYQSLERSISNTTNTSSPPQVFAYIFENNARIAGVSAIPVVGPLFLGFAMYNTGAVAQIIASIHSVPPVLVVTSLFLLPHSWFEFLGYSLAVVVGIYIISEGIRNRFKGAIKVGDLGTAFIFSLAIILLAAALEETEIIVPADAALLLWVPIVVGYWLIRSRRHPPPIQETQVAT